MIMQMIQLGYARAKGYEKCSRLRRDRWRRHLSRSDLEPYAFMVNIISMVTKRVNMIMRIVRWDCDFNVEDLGMAAIFELSNWHSEVLAGLPQAGQAIE